MQRLTVPVVDNFIADLKDAISEAKLAPSGKGTMVMLYGTLLVLYWGCRAGRADDVLSFALI